jgi:hypothetical protein
LQLAVASVIRNEIDIVGSFLQHLDALFDHAVLMDHGSIDGTDRMLRQACARRSGWTLWHVEPVGLHQAAYCGFALRHLFQSTDADFVVLMDADEFIDVPDRASLEAALAGLTDPDRIGLLRWRNLVPDRFDTRAVQPGEPVWHAIKPASLGKAVIPRAFYRRHGDSVRLAHGNHGLFADDETVVPSDDFGALLHLPVRSHTQLINKTIAAVFAVMARAGRNPLDSWHRFDILWRIADGSLRDEDLIGIAARYSEIAQPPPMSRADLQASGFVQATLRVAFGHKLPPPTEPLTIDTARLVATILRRLQVEDARNGTLALDGDHLRLLPAALPGEGVI